MLAGMTRIRFPLAALAAAVLLATSPCAAAGAAKAEGGAVEPVRLPPMSIPLMRGVYRDGSFDLQLLLAFESGEDRARVEALLPRIEAAFFRDLSELARLHVAHGRPTDLDLVGRVLQRAADRVAGAHATRVLIGEAMVRR